MWMSSYSENTVKVNDFSCLKKSQRDPLIMYTHVNNTLQQAFYFLRKTKIQLKNVDKMY